jgi:hypothetical protein
MVFGLVALEFLVTVASIIFFRLFLDESLEARNFLMA